MKKTIVLASLGLFVPCAFAQSSVTLYGILDEGLQYLNNVNAPGGGGKKITLDSINGRSGSRWGFIGSEDLGGQLRAIFTLEGGININNGQMGQGGLLFGRQAFVGLASEKFGTLTMGRQYDPVYWDLEPFTMAYSGSTPFLHPGDNDNTGGSLRYNNSIRYQTLNYGGFKFDALYSLGGVPGNVTANSGYSVAATYTGGAFSFGGAYAYFKNPTGTPGQGLFTNTAAGATLLSGTFNSGYTSATAYQTAGVGAGYTIGNLSLNTSYTNVQYANLGQGFQSGAMARFNNFDFTVKYMWTPAFSTIGAYVYTKGEGVARANGQTVGNQHYNQVSLLADYLLSKRTDVYLEGAFQRASGTSSTGAPAVANIANLGDSSNNQQWVLRASYRHRF